MCIYIYVYIYTYIYRLYIKFHLYFPFGLFTGCTHAGTSSREAARNDANFSRRHSKTTGHGHTTGRAVRNTIMYKIRAVFYGLDFSFVGFCVFVSCFAVPEPSKEVGDVFTCIWGVCCIEFAYGNR